MARTRPRPLLRTLASRLGVTAGYTDVAGRRRHTSDTTREALVAALGWDGSSEEAASRSLRALGQEAAGRGAEPEDDPRLCCVDVSGRAFGVMANLWTVRSASNWGVGDMGDLAALARWAGQGGAAFVGINPLHALHDRTGALSPYSPVSRLFRDPLYIDVPGIPELGTCDEAGRLIAAPGFQGALAAVRRADRLDRGHVMALKWPVLEALARARDADDPAFRAFVARGGETLDAFATFLALDEHFASRAADWRAWPPEYRRPDGPAVRAFRARHASRVAFHRYVQFELDRQLAAAARAASGLAIGLSGDLAIGSAPGGFDSWAFPDLFVSGVYLGAPPDDYSTVGQDWGLPPVNPGRLAADGYRFWTLLLRHALEHMGALRIDHSMGLLRQFWIPAGRPAGEGAYVRFPAAALLRILARESRRHNAVIVAEDLGTVPQGFGALLRRWGLLSTRVLYFEQDRRGQFRPASRYSPRALVLATTHDHPPLVGYWQGRDLDLRHGVGALAEPGAVEAARAQRDRERRALLRRLRAEGLGPPAGAPTPRDLVVGVYGFLARTPAPLVGAALDDLAAEREPLNLPGIALERFPSWTRRMHKAREEIARDPLARAVLAVLREGRGRPRPRPRRRPPGRK